MKLFRNIFLSTGILTTAAFIIFLIYIKLVIEFDPALLRVLIFVAIGLALLAVGVSMAIHIVDLRFATNRLNLPVDERFESPEEWVDVDKQIAIYPRKQAVGTLIMWTVVLIILVIIFHLYLKKISFRDSMFLISGGLIMGAITGGYNYFFFKLFLSPLRRELAPAETPPGWSPTGSMRRMLTNAFISICMALTIFPSAVIFSRLHNMHIDAAHQKGSDYIKFISSKLEGSITPDNKLNKRAHEVLRQNPPDTGAELFLFGPYNDVIYGEASGITEIAWENMRSLDEGFYSDIDTEDRIIFGLIDDSGVKAAVVYRRGYFTSIAMDLVRYMAIVTGMSFLLAVGFIILIRAYIGGSIGRLVNAVEAVAAGDFDRSIPISSDGELGTLENSLAKMKVKLVVLIQTQRNLVGKLGESIKQLGDAAANMRGVAEDQATSAAEQASAAQEAGVTAEEVKQTSEIVAERIDSVNEMASETLEAASTGTSTAMETVDGIRKVDHNVRMIADKMLDLGENIQKIGNVAKTIDEISQRTNLLAINAGIEAVGAGEAGERFGIVADEIRNFAKSTAESADEVRIQVEEIRKAAAESVIFTEEGTKSASAGLHKVETVADAFKLMEGIAGKTSQNAQEIRLSVKQQTTATDQMAKTMRELNETAVQVADGAKKIEAAIGELDKLADELENMLSLGDAVEDSSLERV